MEDVKLLDKIKKFLFIDNGYGSGYGSGGDVIKRLEEAYG